jgi:CRISPR-associated protein Cas2
MTLAVVVTRNVADRYRGFLASVMLETSAGVYVSPRMNAGIRSRTWKVMKYWYTVEPRGSITMVWRDAKETGGIGIETLGAPSKALVDIDGLWVTRHLTP